MYVDDAGGSSLAIVKPEISLDVVVNMLQSLTSAIAAVDTRLLESEQRVKAELMTEVQSAVQQSMSRTEEVLNFVRAEAATYTELRNQQLADRQAQVEQGLSQALHEQQRQVSAIGTAALGAARAADAAATAAETLSRAIPGPSSSVPPSRGGLVDAADATSVHAIQELLTWLRDPSSRGGARIPQLPEGVPYFDGRNPGREGVDAAGFLRSVEAYRTFGKELNISDGMLILMTTSRFVVNGRAFHWWQGVLLDQETKGLPFATYAGFKNVFLYEMRQPDEAISLRLDLEGISLENSRGFRDYVNRFQVKVAKLENLGAGMSKEDKLIRFSRGLASHRDLHKAVKLTARSLEEAIASVTERYNALCLRAQCEGKPSPDEELRRRQPRRRHDGHLHAMTQEDDDEEYLDDEGQQWYDEGEEYDDDGELCAVQMRGVGRRGRGRGRGRFGGRGGFRGRGRAAGGRGQGRDGAGGGAGRGERGGRRNLSPRQLEWFKDGKCVLCGKGGHYAADCPQPAGAENA